MEKGRRLTKKQSVLILVIAIIISLVTRAFGFSLLVVEVVGLFALVSLLTKRGLRWK